MINKNVIQVLVLNQRQSLTLFSTEAETYQQALILDREE